MNVWKQDRPTRDASAVPAPHPWHRLVALGDSFTEGIGDPEPLSEGGLRGWADRVAEELSANQQDFAYANLAVRGLMLQQILDQQLAPALALKPDLVTLSAGGNDIVFRRSDPDRLAEKIDDGVRQLTRSGATVVLLPARTGEPHRSSARSAGRWRSSTRTSMPWPPATMP